MEKTTRNPNILCQIDGLEVRDYDTKQYNGYAFLSLVKVNGKKYLNIFAKTKYKSRGEWKHDQNLVIQLPISEVMKMMNWINKNEGINYRTTKEGRAKFKAFKNENTDK